MKSILLGTSNPYSGEPLAPFPTGCSGWRLWKMLNDRCRISKNEYMAGFIRRNLDTWDRMAKRGSTVVLLGEEVRASFGIPKMLIHPQVVGDIIYRQIPHPSGRNLFYNDPIQRELVAMLLVELYNKGRDRGRQEENAKRKAAHPDPTDDARRLY